MDDFIKEFVSILESHSDEIKKLVATYGPEAAEKIMGMLMNPDSGSEDYYDAMEDMSANDLLDSAISDFQEARQNKKEFEQFLSGIGKGFAVILKAGIKAAISS